MPLYEDNQACIRIAENPCLAERTKHIDIKYHFLRQKVKDKTVNMQYISTYNQIADILTKGLNGVDTRRHRFSMMNM